MNIEKNIYKIVNTVVETLHKKPYYNTVINNINLEYKDIDQIWDYFKIISNEYKEKYKLQEEVVISEDLKNIYNNNNIFKTIFTLHISNEYKEKYKLQEEVVISEDLKNIYNNNNIFKTIFTLHILNDKPHVVTFNINNNENIFILYKNNSDDLPSKFISLTMPSPLDIENENNNLDYLKISCYFED